MPSRTAIIRGLRTPFAKSGTVFARLTALDLAKMAVTELIERSGIDPKTIQEVVFGNVIPSVKAPNIAREIVLGTGLPRKIPGYTIGKACASANQAIAAASDMISRGYSIHFHVWTQKELLDLFLSLKDRLGFDIEMAHKNGDEFVLVLRKQH